MNKMIIGVISIIILVVLVFSLVGGMAGDLVTSADSVTDANNCSTGTDATGVALTYNITDKTCGNSTISGLYTAGQYDLPLNSLFGNSGVVVLMLMVSILIFVITLVFKKKKE